MSKLSPTLLQRYHDDVQRQGFVEDRAQRAAAERLQELAQALSSKSAAASHGWWDRLRGRVPPHQPVPGLYLWGGVGRGKTYLMDLFFAALPFEDKNRYHFHRFMQLVHGELNDLRDTVDPLPQVGERFAASARVICLDEFFVADITDAMLLGGLLDALFSRSVTLVTTSNIAPDDLYRDGLQRSRFLPAIEQIKTHTTVLELAGETDYRLRYLERAELYYQPLGAAAEAGLEQAFASVCPHARGGAGMISIEGRDIPVRRVDEGVVWFDFEAICDGPRSQTDYIEIARLFQTVLIADIPVMDKAMEDQARRFISLIDEFYDRNVKLIVSAAAAVDELYRGERLTFEYRRTVSRLEEMQSHSYLARSHRP